LEGRLLTAIGRLWLQRGENEKAIAYFEQARGVAHDSRDFGAEANAHMNLTVANGALRRYDLSTQHAERALAIARQERWPAGEVGGLAMLMAVWAERGQPRLAIVLGKQAVNGLQATRADLRALDSTIQRSFVSAYEPFYRLLADLLAGQGRLAEAQQVLDLLKEHEFSSFVQRDRILATGQGQATLTAQEAQWEARYREVADRLTSFGARRGALLAKTERTPAEDAEIEKLEADLQVGSRAFESFLNEMEAAFRASKAGAGEVTRVREAEGLMETLRDLGPG
ncbi:MAG: hypothetical protein DMG07_24110, partial [Acidobacteria bacterium]